VEFELFGPASDPFVKLCQESGLKGRNSEQLEDFDFFWLDVNPTFR